MRILKFLEVLLLIAVITTSCKEPEMEIVKLEVLSKEDNFMVYPERGVSEYQRFEYAVISKPPANLKPVIEDYLKSIGKRAEIERKLNYYRIQFYKENNEVTRDYHENEGYLTKDRIDDHYDDVIAKIEWNKPVDSIAAGKWKISIKEDGKEWEVTTPFIADIK